MRRLDLEWPLWVQKRRYVPLIAWPQTCRWWILRELLTAMAYASEAHWCFALKEIWRYLTISQKMLGRRRLDFVCQVLFRFPVSWPFPSMNEKRMPFSGPYISDLVIYTTSQIDVQSELEISHLLFLGRSGRGHSFGEGMRETATKGVDSLGEYNPIQSFFDDLVFHCSFFGKGLFCDWRRFFKALSVLL